MRITVRARTMDDRINFSRTGCVWMDVIEIETPRYEHHDWHDRVARPFILPRVTTVWWLTR